MIGLDPSFTHHKSKILILERESNLRLLYRLEFEDEGYHVLLAKDTEHALAMLDESAPDLLVIEYLLPITAPYSALLQIATDQKGIPVILHSGYPNSLLAHPLGNTIQYLIKSPNLEKLKKKIEEILRNKRVVH